MPFDPLKYAFKKHFEGKNCLLNDMKKPQLRTWPISFAKGTFLEKEPSGEEAMECINQMMQLYSVKFFLLMYYY